MLNKIKTYIKNLCKYLREGGVVYVNLTFTNPEKRFDGKKVFITGGTSGIGLQIAKDFLSEGAIVTITGRNIERLNRVKNEINNNNLHVIEWDIKDINKRDEIFSQVHEKLGNIDIFINNAGVYDSPNWQDVTPEQYDYIVDTNTKSLYFICQREGAYMINNNIKGKIINITSVEGIQSNFSPYSTSKWGSIGITKGLAKLLIKEGINVNGIAPGIVLTNISQWSKKKNINDNAYTPSHLTQRYTLVEEISSMALYLSSDIASNIVGQNIVIDGGWTLN